MRKLLTCVFCLLTSICLFGNDYEKMLDRLPANISKINCVIFNSSNIAKSKPEFAKQLKNNEALADGRSAKLNVLLDTEYILVCSYFQLISEKEGVKKHNDKTIPRKNHKEKKQRVRSINNIEKNLVHVFRDENGKNVVCRAKAKLDMISINKAANANSCFNYAVENILKLSDEYKGYQLYSFCSEGMKPYYYSLISDSEILEATSTEAAKNYIDTQLGESDSLFNSEIREQILEVLSTQKLIEGMLGAQWSFQSFIAESNLLNQMLNEKKAPADAFDELDEMSRAKPIGRFNFHPLVQLESEKYSIQKEYLLFSDNQAASKYFELMKNRKKIGKTHLDGKYIIIETNSN